MSEIRDKIEPIENVDFTNWKKNKFTTLIISLISTIFLSACLGFVIFEIGLFSFGAIILFSIILFFIYLITYSINTDIEAFEKTKKTSSNTIKSDPIKQALPLDNIVQLTKNSNLQNTDNNVSMDPSPVKEEKWNSKSSIISIFILILIVLIKYPNQTLTFVISASWWLAFVFCGIYFIQGFRNNKWWGKIQGGFLIGFFVLSVVNGYLADKCSPYLIKYCVFGSDSFKYYHYTVPSSKKSWIRLRINRNKTWELWNVKPDAGSWGNPITGKLSDIKTQRYSDNGKLFYAIYLEHFPFYGEQTLLSFENAMDDTPFMKYGEDDWGQFVLDEGDDINPWGRN